MMHNFYKKIIYFLENNKNICFYNKLSSTRTNERTKDPNLLKMSTIFETFENFSKTFKNLFKRGLNREEYFNAIEKIISFLEEGVESQDRKRIYYVKNNKYTGLNGMMNVYGKFMWPEKKRELIYDNYFIFKQDASTRLSFPFWLELLKDVYFIDVSEIKKNHLVEDWKGDGTQRILQVYHNRNKQHLLAEFPTVDGVPGIFEVKPDPLLEALEVYDVQRILQVDVSKIEKNLFVEALGVEDAKRILEFDISSIKMKHFNNKKV